MNTLYYTKRDKIRAYMSNGTPIEGYFETMKQLRRYAKRAKYKKIEEHIPRLKYGGIR